MFTRLLTLSALFSIVSLSPAHAQTTDNAEIRKDVEAANRAMESAFNRGDLLQVARFYADDATIMGPRGERLQGRERLDSYWTSIRDPLSWKLDVLEVGGSKDEPWQLGRSTLITGKPGQTRSSITDFIVLWRRQSDGSLKIHIDMYPGGGGGN